MGKNLHYYRYLFTNFTETKDPKRQNTKLDHQIRHPVILKMHKM